jgi:hypothetical protein
MLLISHSIVTIDPIFTGIGSAFRLLQSNPLPNPYAIRRVMLGISNLQQVPSWAAIRWGTFSNVIRPLKPCYSRFC